ncbi:hypothetical protein BS78_02G330600 [Paspalum vaginatum]|nr:hypothetical protein BS78_02G330600 [Paspalum vaginatum]
MFENYDSYGYDRYYYASTTAPAAAAASYTPSRSSRKVCEEEGILDLEEDGAVVKEVAGQYSAPGSGGARSITVAKNAIPASFAVHGYSASGLSSSASPALATTQSSTIADSSVFATRSPAAHKVFDEMTYHQEAAVGRVLHVKVSHMLYPVSEEVMHQLFDPYDAENVQLLLVTTQVEALVSFHCYHDAHASSQCSKWSLHLG